MNKEEFKQFVENETGEPLEDRVKNPEYELETLCGHPENHNNGEPECAECVAIRLNI